MSDRSVTIIIATRGREQRAHLLRRAIESVRTQSGVHATPLVVLNGSDRSCDLERALRADAGLRVLVREEAGLPEALLAGRRAVDSPWFGTLDDDDFLLPHALELRVRELERHAECDIVVTNGYRREGNHASNGAATPSSATAVDELHIPPGFDVQSDPLRAMLRRNWLLPGSWLCRSERVGPSLFEGMPKHKECTFLGVRFATEYAMRWLDEPTVVYHVGSPGAASRSRDFIMGQVDGLERLLELRLPRDVQRAIRLHIAGAYHHAAEIQFRAGMTAEAWRWHLSSLRARGGWRYLPFTRHLLAQLLRAGHVS